MRIDELGEFGLIERIREMLPGPGGDLLVGIGDDVAVLRGSGDRVWLATCDIQIEGAHFLRQSVVPERLGHKALAINLSDIAAAGGTPRYALVSLGLPADLPVEFVDQMYAGLKDEAQAYGVALAGGNIARSNFGLFVDIFLLGEARRDEYMLRSGARVGDRIFVTGMLGDAAAGVALLENPSLVATDTYALTASRRLDTPIPRLEVGAFVARSHSATAMLDISDGLASDLDHICAESHVGARIVAERLPIADENRALAGVAFGDEWHFAVSGGEDYELLFTVPPAWAETFAQKVQKETGVRISEIGEILPPGQGCYLALPDGSLHPLGPSGWDHFKSRQRQVLTQGT